MALITPRNGATLAQVVQTALNVAGRHGVRIATGGKGNAVEVPPQHVAAIERELGWPEAEGTAKAGAVLGSAAHGDTPLPHVPADPPTPPATQVATPDASSDASDPAPQSPATDDDSTASDASVLAAPAKKSTPAKKTTSSRRARRGKEG